MSATPAFSTPAFSTVDDVLDRLRAQAYVADRRIATALFLADRMEKPVLVEGPAGVGKTELAKVLARAVSAELIRLQCYEGLDEAKALYEWEYPKQLLYTQVLRDKIGDVMAGAGTLTEAVDRLAAQEDAFFSERFLLARPLLRAIRAPQRTVLLVDEVDRADAEFEAFLLELLSDFQVTVPELGTLRAAHVPLVILTSNNVRELTDALKRRCLHLHIGYPDAARERAIVEARLPDAPRALAAEVVRVVQAVRELDLKKRPSVSETLDWVRALTLLNAPQLDAALVQETLNLILKYEGDIDRAVEKLPEILARRP
jgi:MoxR-like ATPase